MKVHCCEKEISAGAVSPSDSDFGVCWNYNIRKIRSNKYVVARGVMSVYDIRLSPSGF